MGAVLYRMLTGRPYLDFDTRETPSAQARNVGLIQAQTPVSPSVHNRRVPAWLDAVVLKALDKSPSGRFAGATQMREALQQRGEGAAGYVTVSGAETKILRNPPIRAAPLAAPGPVAGQRQAGPAWYWFAAAGATIVVTSSVSSRRS